MQLVSGIAHCLTPGGASWYLVLSYVRHRKTLLVSPGCTVSVLDASRDPLMLYNLFRSGCIVTA